MIDEAREFLKANKDVSFATCEENKPKIRVFQIMKIEGDDLFFATSPKKAVYRQLHENPYVEIMAFAGQISVKCTGEVFFDVKDADKRWIYKNNPVLPRLYDDYAAIEYFRMRMDTMDYYDLRPTPPIFKHINTSTLEEKDGFVGDKYSK